MKNFICACVASLLLPAVALDYYGQDEWRDVTVATGAEVSLDGGFFGAGSGLSKSGGGDLKGDLSNWYTPAPLTAYLLSGQFVVRTASAPAEALENPTEILERATLWLDATTNRFAFVSEGGADVSYWYDVRETQEDGVWSNAYWAAEARNTNNTTAASETMTYPTRDTAKAALPLVYFHGYGSGSWMKLVSPGHHDGTQGARGLEGIRHLFVVYQFDKSIGYMLGSTSLSYTTRLPAFFHPDSPANARSGIFTTQNSRTELASGAFYVNGARSLVTATHPTGLTVINWNSGYTGDQVSHLADLGSFFNDRNLFSYRRQGGDWLGEVIAFTNSLTAAERTRVEAYLLNKWRGSVTRGAVDLNLSEQASLRLEAPLAEATYSGRGTVEVAGTCSTTVNVSRAGTRFGGTVRVGETATLGVQGAEPTLSLAAGDVWRMTNDGHDVRQVTRTGTGADTAIEITATNTLRLASVPAGVERVRVAGAREVVLAVPRAEAKTLASTDSPLEVTIPNAGFESALSASDWTTGTQIGYDGASKSRLQLNASSWWFDDGLANYTHKTFEGNYCLGLKKAAWAENTVTLPEAGRYEFSCLVSSRSKNYSAGVLDVELVKDGVTTRVGRIYGEYPKTPLRERLLSPVLAAGTYKLRLVLDGQTNRGGDVHIFVDSLRLRYCPETANETVFAVPNGGFEIITNYPATTVNSQERNAYESPIARVFRPEGWTLTGCTNTVADVTALQYMCGAFTRGMAGYVNHAAMTSGSVQLMLSGNEARAESEAFVPPAGTWKVRFRCGSLRGDSNSPSIIFKDVDAILAAYVKAEVSVAGGSWTQLGSSKATDGFDTQTSVSSFTVDGTEAIRLALSQTTANTTTGTARALVDDVELVRAEGEGVELVSNGSFEDGATGWTMLQNKEIGGEKSAAGLSIIGKDAVFYGFETCDGKNHLRLDQVGSAHQSIAFPSAGTYRLSFWTRARPDSLTGDFGGTHAYSGNSVRAYLKDAAQNETEILLTDPVYSWCYVEHSALFSVPAAGTYELWLAGTVDGSEKPVAGVTKTDSHAFVDLVSVKKETPASATPDFSENLSLDLGSAALRLDFPGQITLKGIRFGGRRRSGLINASHPSGLVTGPGSVYVEPNGLAIIVR